VFTKKEARVCKLSIKFGFFLLSNKIFQQGFPVQKPCEKGIFLSRGKIRDDSEKATAGRQSGERNVDFCQVVDIPTQILDKKQR
jgi:hypothetical protein